MKKKEERKKNAGKKGSIYEEDYLYESIQKLIKERLGGVQSECRLCRWPLLPSHVRIPDIARLALSYPLLHRRHSRSGQAPSKHDLPLTLAPHLRSRITRQSKHFRASRKHRRRLPLDRKPRSRKSQTRHHPSTHGRIDQWTLAEWRGWRRGCGCAWVGNGWFRCETATTEVGSRQRELEIPDFGRVEVRACVGASVGRCVGGGVLVFPLSLCELSSFFRKCPMPPKPRPWVWTVLHVCFQVSSHCQNCQFDSAARSHARVMMKGWK